MMCLVCDYCISRTEISGGLLRNDSGGGKKTQELEVEIEGMKRESVVVELAEQLYSDEETKSMMRRCVKRIEKEMLGENKSLDRVEKNLNLITSISDEPVRISWEIDRYDVMNIRGEIMGDELKADGTMVNLEAVLTYTENPDVQALFQCTAVIYPKESETKEITMLKERIREKEASTREKKKLILPEMISGKRVRYFRRMQDRGVILMLMGLLVGGLFYALEIQEKEQTLKDKKKQMQLDYPEIVNELTLFLGAGMTIKRSFTKIAREYEKRRTKGNVRFAYEEMLIACREMESGITESESYERFGRRCNEAQYIRLGALLSQNLRKGTKGLNEMLRLEAIQAFEERKTRAKMLGEEAGIKLLLPMFIMLAIVLVIVIVPAFLSMQM